jgi:hypothetical protein
MLFKEAPPEKLCHKKKAARAENVGVRMATARALFN